MKFLIISFNSCFTKFALNHVKRIRIFIIIIIIIIIIITSISFLVVILQGGCPINVNVYGNGNVQVNIIKPTD